MNDKIQPLLLWLPASRWDCDEEFSHHAAKVTAANDAVLDFCSFALSLNDTLERLDFYGADVDDYLGNLEVYLRHLGA